MPSGVYIHHANQGFQKDHSINIGRESWNKGLTKETDARVMQMALKISSSNKGSTKERFPLRSNGGRKKGCRSWCEGLTKETDARLVNTSSKQKEHWKDPEFAKMMLHRRTPSGPEQTFIDLCKEFRFIGNGDLVIDGKNPDFVCINDGHKLIEIWGEYFKKNRNPQDLVDFYKIRGYDCLIIWASELSHEEKVMAKIRKFKEA